MLTRYEKALKNPELARILEAECLLVEAGELLAQKMQERGLNNFDLVCKHSITYTTLQRILQAKEVDLRLLSSLFHSLGYRLEIQLVPLNPQEGEK